MKYCTKCGKEIMDEAVICPGCGCPTAGTAEQNFQEINTAEITQTTINICEKCGRILAVGEEFCPNCGTKKKKVKRKKNKAIKIMAISVSLVILSTIAFGVVYFLKPSLFMSIDQLCAEGLYAEAFEKADNKDEQAKIWHENIGAVAYKTALQKLPDPSKTELVSIYILNSFIYLQCMQRNANGDTPIHMYLKLENGYIDWRAHTSSLTDETIYSFDSEEEADEKITFNLYKANMRLIRDLGDILSNAAISRINTLSKNTEFDQTQIVTFDPYGTDDLSVADT